MKMLIVKKILMSMMVLMLVNGLLIAQDYTIANETNHDQNHFGWNISGSGKYCAISDPRDVVNDYGNGSVSVYRKKGSDWQFMQRITKSNPSKHDLFGDKTALEGAYLAVSATGNSDKGFMSGEVLLYQLVDNSWSLLAEIFPKKSDDKMYFGSALAISGNTLIVGASGVQNNAGEVYVYEIQSSGVALIQTIEAPHPIPYEFGKTLEFKEDQLFIGAPSTVKTAIKGGVFVYKLSNGQWEKVQDIAPEDEEAGSLFGYSISSDNENLFISAPHTNVSHIDGENYVFSGKVYHYMFSDGSWNLNGEITGETPASHDYFGSQIRVSDGELFVSAPAADLGRLNQGEIYKYVEASGEWNVTDEYVVAEGNTTMLGSVFCVINGEILVGNGGQKEIANQGIVYVFDDGFEPLLGADKVSELLEINVFPNPASDIVTIETGEFRTHKLEIYDLNGVRHLRKIFVQSTEIDVSDLTAGVYIISLTAKDQSQSKTLIIR